MTILNEDIVNKPGKL